MTKSDHSEEAKAAIRPLQANSWKDYQWAVSCWYGVEY